MMIEWLCLLLAILFIILLRMDAYFDNKDKRTFSDKLNPEKVGD